ncbi:MAG TPA: HAD-IA family hydrolase [Kofleriaceae bacterium]|nr:HAD-IA family hydrolase [Kofleriaceae bacterium]
MPGSLSGKNCPLPVPTTTRALLERYDGLLLDLYGVLVDAGGLLPGAREFLDELERWRTPFAFVSNDASRSTATYVARFAAWGVNVEPHRFVTSGSLLPAYVADRQLAGARVAVLGTKDSEAFVREGGGVVVPVRAGMEIDALAVCDDAGFAFLDGLELSLSAVVRAIEAGRRPTLVLPNPDLVYPKSPGELGFTAGTMALMIEAALERRFPGANLVFDRLGKPEPHLFTAAAKQLGIAADRLVMIGDQLETDIAGANAAGVPSALLAGSISRWTQRDEESTVGVERGQPDWLLESLSL